MVVSLDYLFEEIEKWADDKGLLKEENAPIQMCKVTEEVGEVAQAICKDNIDLLEDGIGDSFVTLIILARQKGLDPARCLERAYQEIKDRKGKTVNGSFIKEQDLK